ncbi:MAG: DNA-directed RNA polymerase subunit alpha [Candidatus Portnoybacteria bacterium CG03_land_8_20_14_0_80_41_10]|uniref:DNA-directed RNA polymerase subunit alpha n=1 Tax=Candidatus Portnoybacteria bacterium CG03_land_8_20_14_0_80_41_10 TaxID=1974808 RepID=A0A2M7BV56_9BACT|nr:MAG: DNA-directed RNA polymerase subunit alpha [Candidatus Portnoybacteria bacterium CG03_land_8_20_14_0_80_41_10]
MITLPHKPKIIEKKNNLAVIEIEACYPGYGTTLGNVLRRVLLSSLPGAAITGVKIKGVQHEFSAIPYIVEDVVQIILNLKQVRFKLYTDQPVRVSLKAKGEREVTAADIKTTSQLEIANPKMHLATLSDKRANLEMELEIEPGLGYSATESRKKGKLEIGRIALDAIFSPVRKVNYSIEHTRVGERTDYDRLRVTVETDGTVSPEDAFQKAAQILVDHFKVLAFLGEKIGKKVEKAKVKIDKKKTKKTSPQDKKNKEIARMKINDLKISAQAINLLEEGGVKTVGGLIKKKEADLKKIEGLGQKRIVEIKRALGKLGSTLRS